MLINIDNGGTFTDFWALAGGRKFRTKTRTTPHDLSECLFAGLKSLAELVYDQPDLARLLGDTRYLRYSTTQGTNALVQRKGPRLGLVLDQGTTPAALNTHAAATEMFDALVGTRTVSLSSQCLRELASSAAGGETSEQLSAQVLRTVNELTNAGANRIVLNLGDRAAEHGFMNLVQRLFPQHLLGTVPILPSSDVTADTSRPRAAWTALLNAFLHPAMERFLFNTDQRLRDLNSRAPLLVFRNDGLAGRVVKTPAIMTYGSGPEGGMRGAAALAALYQYPHLVTIDVGGTTTDIGLIANGQAPLQRYGQVEEVDVSIPMSELRSIGVGGGSLIRVKANQITVGPESSGAMPGPACFGFGGVEATLTDIKLLTGFIDPERYFGGQMRLDRDRAQAAVTKNIGQPLGLTLDAALDAGEAAWVAAVATQLRPHLKPDTVLGAFGGAGPFSACAIADAVGVKKILVPGMAAVFSASGIGQSDIGHRYHLAVDPHWDAAAFRQACDRLLTRAARDMSAEGFALSDCKQQWAWEGSDQNHGANQFDALFAARQGSVNLGLTVMHPLVHDGLVPDRKLPPQAAPSRLKRRANTGGGALQDLPVHELGQLTPGCEGQGPAIIEDEYFTLPVGSGWRFRITANHDIELERRA
jgi:N-methylhydantoinase A/oxoprolinase/acetone carboxylase beta subunit